MLKLVNLTPHEIVIIRPEGRVAIPPSGDVARVSTTPGVAGIAHVEGGILIPLARTTFGEVVGLPAPEEGVLFIVSALVRAACPNRGDVASPGDLLRGENGQPIGCQNLIVN